MLKTAVVAAGVIYDDIDYLHRKRPTREVSDVAVAVATVLGAVYLFKPRGDSEMVEVGCWDFAYVYLKASCTSTTTAT